MDDSRRAVVDRLWSLALSDLTAAGSRWVCASRTDDHQRVWQLPHKATDYRPESRAHRRIALGNRRVVAALSGAPV